jgi:hypothetical protein
MRTFTKITAAVMLIALGLSARASIVIPPTVVTYNGISNPAYQLAITYEVTLNAGLYTYSYDLATTPAEEITSFTIGGTPDPVDTESVVITSYGGADPTLSGPTADSIVFQWDFNSGITSADVSYTSVNGPRLATFTLNDDDVDWGSPPGIPAPTPVPEASTVIAGAVMILPLGVSAFRALRKGRKV